MATAFPDVKPFPTPSAGPGLASVGHNRPPLDEEVVSEFKEGLRTTPNLMKKIGQLTDPDRVEGIVAKCADAEQAGKYADASKQISTCIKAIDGEREKHNRPLLTAQRALKGAADNIVAELKRVDGKLRGAINAYQREEQQKADEERRRAAIAAEEARRAAEEAAAANPEAPAPVIEVAPAPVEEAKVRGDFGAQAGTSQKWQGEVEKVRQLPDRILNNAKVIEAINKVINAEVRGGARDIKGARIWAETVTTIR